MNAFLLQIAILTRDEGQRGDNTNTHTHMQQVVHTYSAQNAWMQHSAAHMAAEQLINSLLTQRFDLNYLLLSQQASAVRSNSFALFFSVGSNYPAAAVHLQLKLPCSELIN